MNHEMDTRTPVHILTGFLGSGKTTLLRNLLADPALADTAVIINEFGEVGLDHLLVKAVAEDVVLLSSGCICCSVGDDLLSTLADLHEMRKIGDIPHFTRVIVETTGLANPAPIMQAILSEKRLTPCYRLGQVITAVDAVNGSHTLAAYGEARQQLAMADRLIVTKYDLVGEAGGLPLIDHLRSQNPDAALTFARQGVVDAAEILTPPYAQWLRPEKPRNTDGKHSSFFPLGFVAVVRGEKPRNTDGKHSSYFPVNHHDKSIETFTVRFDRPVNWDAFVEWLELLLMSRGDSVLRVKGLLAIAGDERPVIVQGVQYVLYPPERLNRWPDPTNPHGWLVFIARDLTADAIEMSLQSLADDFVA